MAIKTLNTVGSFITVCHNNCTYCDMDIIKSQNIKVPSSILIFGLMGTEVDEELVEFLQEYGPISRVVPVDSSDPDFKNTTVVEFQFGTVIRALQDDLPCQRCTSDPSVMHSIQLLSPLYSSKLTSSLTQSYLTDLKGVAKLSGTDYETLLLDELNRISENQQTVRVCSLLRSLPRYR